MTQPDRSEIGVILFIPTCAVMRLTAGFCPDRCGNLSAPQNPLAGIRRGESKESEDRGMEGNRAEEEGRGGNERENGNRAGICKLSESKQ